MQQRAYRFYRFAAVNLLIADPFKCLVDGICISEDVVRGFPIGMLVGGAKARDPERCRIGQCSTEVCWGAAIPRRGGERIDDRDRIVAEKTLGQ